MSEGSPSAHTPPNSEMYSHMTLPKKAESTMFPIPMPESSPIPKPPSLQPHLQGFVQSPAFNPTQLLETFRLNYYQFAMNERLRMAAAATAAQYLPSFPSPMQPWENLLRMNEGVEQPLPSGFAMNYANPLLFQMKQFDPRFAFLRLPGVVEEPKPQHSYIGLIAFAILSSPDTKLVLSDIYQYILDNYPYFRTRGPGWRNSIRHNLSLNDCFVKAGRSANGKGHYWAIHPANLEDFKRGDFRRRKAQRKVRKHMGLCVDGEDSPTPPSSPLGGAFPESGTPPLRHGVDLQLLAAEQPSSSGLQRLPLQQTPVQPRRMFDMATLLAPRQEPHRNFLIENLTAEKDVNTRSPQSDIS